MKRIFTSLVVLATGMTLSMPAFAQNPAPAAPRPQRIVIVNIAKVLRDYEKANFQGAEITRRRQEYVSQVNILREQLAVVQKEFNLAAVPDEKKKLQEKALNIQRKVEDIDREAQVELTKVSNDTIVRVYQEIKGVIADIATTNSLDMVLCYPAASKPEDEASPQVAQLMLQTPAMIPFYHKGMDITEVVIKTLNGRYPPPKPVTKNDLAPAPTPTPGVKTVGGNN
ncbi:OmpH family outer membrane protein [Zavarzinella formosa]|uniref:OmpH family outer membrane protein n=1 Tax=Zavarzinella formosa TaxID=360055 RepID=UPI0002F469F0|nr:OmpH family outer membrane protein [Zavarzinella formosa]